MAESYRDLAVWHRAMQLCVALYRLTAKFPPEEMNGITGQLRRAGVVFETPEGEQEFVLETSSVSTPRPSAVRATQTSLSRRPWE